MYSDYHRPESLNQAFELMQQAKGQARYFAGGTDLMVRIKQGLVQPRTLISLRRIGALQGIEQDGTDLVIKSMTLLRDVETDPLVRKQAPVLQQAVASLANVQVKNVATLGGNLVNASPAGDSIPPLLVLEAQLVLAGPDKERILPLTDFFIGPGQTRLESCEILKAVKIPGQPVQSRAAFTKIGRTAKDLAVVNAAALIQLEGSTCSLCRLAAGAVGPVPLRLPEAEAMLQGQTIDSGVLEAVQAEVGRTVSPITDIRAGEAYRRELAGTLIKRSIQKAMGNTLQAME